MKIKVADALLQNLRELDPVLRKKVGTSINLAAEAWGRPHLHAGIGIRKLTIEFFECRAGLQTRLVFRAEPNELHFVFMGNHNEVRRFLGR